MLGLEDTGTSDKLESIALVIINSSDIDGATGGIGVDDAHITPQNTSIGSPVNKGVGTAAVTS